MSSYDAFARVYDVFTSNIDYKKRADYFCELLARYTDKKGICLDLACGTGTLCEEFFCRGFEVIGVDNSFEMLSIANSKKYSSNSDITYLCQDMTKLDLYGTVDVVFCVLDSLNHITQKSKLQHVFDKIALFLDTEGYFVFDLNTEYKHYEILANNCFVFEDADNFLVWQNELSKNKVSITLDIFEKNQKNYMRTTESFCERAYTKDEIVELLNKSGLELVDVFDEDNFNSPHEKSERLIYVAKHRKKC
jgi:SAM-dependent methyltransferase